MNNVSFSQYYFLTIENMFGQQKISNHQNSHKAFQKRIFLQSESICRKTMFIHIWLLCISRTSKYTTLLPATYPKAFLWSFRGSTFFLPRLQETVIGLCHPSYYSQCIFVDTGNSICMYLNIVWWEYPWTNWQFLF